MPGTVDKRINSKKFLKETKSKQKKCEFIEKSIYISIEVSKIESVLLQRKLQWTGVDPSLLARMVVYISNWLQLSINMKSFAVIS